jgi:hypothetical protein
MRKFRPGSEGERMAMAGWSGESLPKPDMPECMAPDGAEPCAAYTRLTERVAELKTELSACEATCGNVAREREAAEKRADKLQAENERLNRESWVACDLHPGVSFPSCDDCPACRADKPPEALEQK